MTSLKPETREKLKTVSTATLATALFKRGLRNQMIQDVQPLNPHNSPMVGEAYTLRYMPAREDLNPITVFQDREHPQRKAVRMPDGAVLVIDSRKNARAASAGGILVSRLMNAASPASSPTAASVTRRRSRNSPSPPTTTALRPRPT